MSWVCNTLVVLVQQSTPLEWNILDTQNMHIPPFWDKQLSKSTCCPPNLTYFSKFTKLKSVTTRKGSRWYMVRWNRSVELFVAPSVVRLAAAQRPVAAEWCAIAMELDGARVLRHLFPKLLVRTWRINLGHHPLGRFLFVGFTKGKVHATSVPDLAKLHAQISETANTLMSYEFETKWREINYRLDILQST